MRSVITSVNANHPSEVLSMLQKIINLTSRQNGNDITTLSRWLRCLFNLTLTYDETISLKCLDQVTQIAAKKHKVRPVGTISIPLFLSMSSVYVCKVLSCRCWQPLLHQAL
jgi:hypothetical protein